MTTRLMHLLTPVGCTLASLSFVPLATALELSLVDTLPPDWIDLGWKAEGRAGAPLGEDYEFAIGPDGAQADNTGQIYQDWENGVDVNWSLNWEGTTASLTVGDQTISYWASPPAGSQFEAFSLLTNVQTETDFVEPGTQLDLVVDSVNGVSVDNIFAQSIAPQTGSDLQQLFWESDELLFNLAGTARVSWDFLNPNQAKARSRVDFQIVGFNTSEPSTIPEPSSVLGLLTIGTLTAVSRLIKL